MSEFASHLRAFPVAHIVKVLGCSAVAAYQYQAGTRNPPEWQRTLFINALGPAPAAAPVVDGAKRGRGRPRKPVAA